MYFQIGLVTLLGLAAKNAILIVEYAVLKKEEGMSASAAAMEAARLRFRPILMTSLAFIFGVLPLAISTGAGAGARHSTGTGVMGGMIAATFLAIFFVPLFYRVIIDRRIHESRSKNELANEIDHAYRVAHLAPPRDARPSAARRRGREAMKRTLISHCRRRARRRLRRHAAGAADARPARRPRRPTRRTRCSSAGGPRSTTRC